MRWGRTPHDEACVGLCLLLELRFELWAGEVAAERCMRNAILLSECPQRLPRRPPANQLRVRNQPTKTTIAALHSSD